MVMPEGLLQPAACLCLCNLCLLELRHVHLQ